MVLPDSYGAALLLIIVSMLCWGSWANTYKLAGRWRFELFYFDYALGVLLAAAAAAFTFGTLGFDGLGFTDDLMHAGRRSMFYGFAGGVVFNLANMLLVAAIAVAGLALAFPVGIGLALVIGVIWNYAINPQGNPALLFTGVAVVVAAIVADAAAYGRHVRRAAGQTGPARRTSRKGVALSLASGVLMESFYPLVEMGKTGARGLGPYAISLIFAAGVFLSTFVFNLFFMRLPVEGEPVAALDYLKGKPRQHVLGIAGGMIWAAGAIANFVAASAPPEVQVGPAISYALGQGATLISALWGLLVWKEFAGAEPRVRLLLALMLVLFAAGLTLVSIAPLYAG